MVDHFTTYAEITSIPNKEASTVANAFFCSWILKHGVPSFVLSDQGREFVNKILEQLSEILGIKMLHTSGFRPQTNGLCERQNRTINQFFRMHFQAVRGNWVPLIPYVQYTANNLPCFPPDHSYTPYELVFGRRPKDALDSLWRLSLRSKVSLQTYATVLRATLRSLRETHRVLKDLRAQQMRGTSRNTATPLEIGDLVLYFRPRINRNNTIPSKWSVRWDGPFRIHQRVGENSYVLVAPEAVSEEEISAQRLKVPAHRAHLYKLSSPVYRGTTPLSRFLPTLPGEPEVIDNIKDESVGIRLPTGAPAPFSTLADTTSLAKGQYVFYFCGERTVMLGRVLVSDGGSCIVQPYPYLRQHDGVLHFGPPDSYCRKVKHDDILLGNPNVTEDGQNVLVPEADWHDIVS